MVSNSVECPDMSAPMTHTFTVLVNDQRVIVSVLGECYLQKYYHWAYMGRGSDGFLYAVHGDSAIRLAFDDFHAIHLNRKGD